MGIFHSKIAPVSKPTEQLNVFDDPRSPTVNINRSPIGTESVLGKPIVGKVRDLTTDLAEILDNAQTPDRLVPEKLQSVLDPRSPSMFLRTPLVLDESNASNISLRGSSIEYEEIDCDGELSFKDCTATDISGTLGEDRTVISAGSIFSNNTSLNTELKADIDDIIQKLYDAGSSMDPRSPSVAILRTPMVLQEEPEEESEIQDENQAKEEPIDEQPLVQQPVQQDNTTIVNEEEKITTTTAKMTIVHQDENTTTPVMVTTPKRNNSDLSGRKAAVGGPRTPLGCVTNVQPVTNGTVGGNDVLRKTALIGQMKQSAATGGLMTSAEVVAGVKKPQTRSKIPTFRMK